MTRVSARSDFQGSSGGLNDTIICTIVSSCAKKHRETLHWINFFSGEIKACDLSDGVMTVVASVKTKCLESFEQYGQENKLFSVERKPPEIAFDRMIDAKSYLESLQAKECAAAGSGGAAYQIKMLSAPNIN